MASIKMGACMLLYPIYCCCSTILFYLYMSRHASTLECLIWVLLFLTSFPVITIISIRSADGVVTHFKTGQARILTLFNTE
mmetsp:Transcript_2192/g.2129  ORF Transcript_2192/g.2129 Transcript_2192/m.2129 type:complete len:81 (-) Transcript_2192:306-548(-)